MARVDWYIEGVEFGSCNCGLRLPVRRTRPRRDRQGHRVCAHLRHPRAGSHPARKPWAQKGDLNDWLRLGAKGDPGAFQSILERAIAARPTPWALQIQRLPTGLGAVGSG